MNVSKATDCQSIIDKFIPRQLRKNFTNQMVTKHLPKNQRIKEIDYIKGVAILIVVFGHCLAPIIREKNIFLMFIYNCIYSFHMPLFMAVSGFLYGHKKRNNLNCNNYTHLVKTKFKQLLIPYFSLSFILFFTYYIFFNYSEFGKTIDGLILSYDSLSDYFANLLLCNEILDKHLWFLYVLFFIFFFFPLVLMLNNKFGKPLTLLLLVSIDIFFHVEDFGSLRSIYFIYHFTVIFYSGFAFATYPKTALGQKKIVLLCLFFVLVLFMGSTKTFFDNFFPFHALFKAIHLSIGFLALPSFYFCFELWNIPADSCLGSFLRYIGERTFEIYLFHQPVFVNGIIAFLIMALSISPYIVIPAAFVSGVLFPLLLSKFVINKSRFLSFLFGLRYAMQPTAPRRKFSEDHLQ